MESDIHDVELLDAKEVIEGKNYKKKKGYRKYEEAVNRINFVGWIREEIDRKPDRTIVVKIDDVAKEMGSKFEKVGHGVLYQALKTILFQNGIFLSMGTHRDGDKTFILRERRKEDRLAPSYLFVKKAKRRIKRRIIAKKDKNSDTDTNVSNGDSDKGDNADTHKEIDNKDISSHPDRNLLREVIKDRDNILSESKKEKALLLEEIKQLKKTMNGRLGDNSYMVEIFQFNWETLTWRMVKRKSVKMYNKLFEILMESASTKENRYRFELTPIAYLEKIGKGVPLPEGDNELTEKDEDMADGDGEKSDGKENHEEIKGEELKDKNDNFVKEVVCPRCGSKNVKSWYDNESIKTFYGNKILRHRCRDCNEIFADEDISR